MLKKAPIINGQRLDKRYDLDDKHDVLTLGLDPEPDLKIADEYSHYEDCRFAVIEYGSTLHTGVKQVESTVNRLLTLGRKIDIPIIVVDRLNRFEQRIFKRRKDYILRKRETNNPYLIKVGSKVWVILLFYSHEVNRMYDGLNKYLLR